MNKMRKLSKEHLELLASASGVPLVYIEKLKAMGLIKQPRAIDVIVAYHWGVIAQTSNLTEDEVVDYFTKRLGVPRKTIHAAIHKSANKSLYCVSCGKYISVVEREISGDKCSNCIATERYVSSIKNK